MLFEITSAKSTSYGALQQARTKYQNALARLLNNIELNCKAFFLEPVDCNFDFVSWSWVSAFPREHVHFRRKLPSKCYWLGLVVRWQNYSVVPQGTAAGNVEGANLLTAKASTLFVKPLPCQAIAEGFYSVRCSFIPSKVSILLWMSRL